MNLSKAQLDRAQVASMIDHTVLRPEATAARIIQLCQEAREHRLFSVCVNPKWVPLAVKELQGSSVLVVAVVGFPLGAMLSHSKAAETVHVIQAGAQEVDMVMDIGAAKDGDWARVGEDIGTVVKAAGEVPVKVILETCYLSEDEIRQASRVCKEQGAAFVKTSTGFGSAGATVDHVRLMREVVGPDLGVKASGGVKTLADLKAMVEAGATRIGTSSALHILSELSESHS